MCVVRGTCSITSASASVHLCMYSYMYTCMANSVGVLPVKTDRGGKTCMQSVQCQCQWLDDVKTVSKAN